MDGYAGIGGVYDGLLIGMHCLRSARVVFRVSTTPSFNSELCELHPNWEEAFFSFFSGGMAL